MNKINFNQHETEMDEDGVIKVFDQEKQQHSSCDIYKQHWPANPLPDISAVPKFSRPQAGPDPVYGIENLVFEGGGVKGLAYAGAIQELKELGVLKHVKRIAGASVGSIVAMALAVGFPVEMLIKLMKEAPLEEIFEDGNNWAENKIPLLKKLHSLYHLFGNLGVYPGLEAFVWLGELLQEQTGSADITFAQVYERYGCELCVVVGNVTLGRPEWFHVKTYPNFPIRRAVRMSMSIPFFFKPWREHVGDSVHCFTDGGIYCNYPIHVWDGWLLSMSSENAYHQKLPEITDPLDLTTIKVFSPPTSRTLGFKVYDDGDVSDIGRFWKYHYRLDDSAMPSDTESKLVRHFRKKQASKERNEEEIKACKKLMKDICQLMKDQDRSYLIREEFLALVPEILHGEEMFENMDHDANMTVSLREVLTYLENKGIHWRAEVGGDSAPTEIKNIINLGTQLVSSLSQGNYRRWYRDSDPERTISIDVRYIGTTDFELEEADKNYCLDAGTNSVKCWARDVHQRLIGERDNKTDLDEQKSETVDKLEKLETPVENFIEDIQKKTTSMINGLHAGQ